MEDITKLSLGILKTIRQADLGTLGLVSVFKGYKSKQVMQNKLYTLPGYGALYWLTPDGIKDVLRQLEASGIIRTVNIGPEMGTLYRIPKVRLTSAGEKALQDSIAIPLLVNSHQRDLPRDSDTVLETISLFKVHKSTTRVANARNLKETTIWDHLKTGIKLGLIVKKEIFSAENLAKVADVKREHPDATLTELRSLLPWMSYAELLCALTAEEKAGAPTPPAPSRSSSPA